MFCVPLQLIESFENQLTNMKAELSDKDRMLSMYENSMADLSSKMHLLKKSLEEKVVQLHGSVSQHAQFTKAEYNMVPVLTWSPSKHAQALLYTSCQTDNSSHVTRIHSWWLCMQHCHILINAHT